MSKKRQRRIQETNALYEESVHAQVVADGLGHRDDKDLFVVDRQGSKRARRKIEEEVLPKKEGTYLSASDKAVLKKIQQQQGKQISSSSSSSTLPRHATSKVLSPLEDLWATESVSASAATISSTAIGSAKVGGEGSRKMKQGVIAGNRKLKKPLPGQSYHPSQAAHQDVLAEALANELRRQAQEKDNEKVDLKAILADSRAVTHLFLSDSHDSSDDDEQVEDGVEEEDSDSNRNEKARPSKLTRAQRNRQHQLRSQAAHLVKKKREARLLSSIDQVKQINRMIDQEEAKREQEHALRKLQASSSSPNSGALVLDVNQVPLSDELHGSLRLVKAKGVPLRDAVQSLVSSGQANSQQRLGRLKRAHPHKAKKIKWVAKYKYGVSER